MLEMDYEKLYEASMMMDPSQLERGIDQWMMQNLQAQQQSPLMGGTPSSNDEAPQSKGMSSALGPQSLGALNQMMPQGVQPHWAPPAGVGHASGNIQLQAVAPQQQLPGGPSGKKSSMSELMYGRRK